MGASAVNDQSSDNAPKSHTKSEPRMRLSITTYRLRLIQHGVFTLPLNCFAMFEGPGA